MKTEVALPWWKYWNVWLIISGPLVVVIASAITIYLTIIRPDPVIDNYYRKGVEINKKIDAERAASRVPELVPAMRARNHAATGADE